MSVVPFTGAGMSALAAALVDADEHLDDPVMVWWLSLPDLRQHRGTVYGWSTVDGERRALVVSRLPGPDGLLADDVRWVPEGRVRVRVE